MYIITFDCIWVILLWVNVGKYTIPRLPGMWICCRHRLPLDFHLTFPERLFPLELLEVVHGSRPWQAQVVGSACWICLLDLLAGSACWVLFVNHNKPSLIPRLPKCLWQLELPHCIYICIAMLVIWLLWALAELGCTWRNQDWSPYSRFFLAFTCFYCIPLAINNNQKQMIYILDIHETAIFHYVFFHFPKGNKWSSGQNKKLAITSQFGSPEFPERLQGTG